MKFLLPFSLLFILSVAAFGQAIKSPNDKLMLNFKLNDEGIPVCSFSFQDKPVVKESRLGIELQNQPHLIKHFRIVSSATSEKMKLGGRFGVKFGRLEIITAN